MRVSKVILCHRQTHASCEKLMRRASVLPVGDQNVTDSNTTGVSQTHPHGAALIVPTGVGIAVGVGAGQLNMA